MKMVKYDQQINVKVSKRIDKALDKYAVRNGVKKATLARMLIVAGLAKLDREVGEAL